MTPRHCITNCRTSSHSDWSGGRSPYADITILHLAADPPHLSEVAAHLNMLFPDCLIVPSSDRAEAVAAMEQHDFVLILVDDCGGDACDGSMVDGSEFVYLARTHVPNTPVVVIPEHFDVDTVTDFYQAGAAEVVRMRSIELVPTLERLMSRLNSGNRDRNARTLTSDLRDSTKNWRGQMRSYGFGTRNFKTPTLSFEYGPPL